MSGSKIRTVLTVLDEVGLIVISALLLAAFYYQIVLHELPCALCNLIRVAFLVLGAGLLLNIRFGINPWNYVISACGGLVGSLISLLFMFAKALPGTKPTGSAILGFHMYNWTFVFFTIAIMYFLVVVSLYAVDGQCETKPYTRTRTKSARLAVVLFTVVAVGNFASSFLQNGFGPFKASNQQHYQMFYDGDVMQP